MNAYALYTGQGKTKIEVVRGENHRKMETNIIEIFPCMERQTFHGFGGALTHASGYVLSRMDKDAATEVIRKYYAPDGAGYRFVRIPIDSSDFSPVTFNAGSSLDAISNDQYDFSYDEKYIFPWLDVIYESAEADVPILLSPWSPPAFMKDNRSRLQGGRLLSTMKPYWARYLSRYVGEYRRRGYNIWGLTIQNEPNAIQSWESCLYSAEEERDFLIDYLKPELDTNGLNDIRIFFWDHNKERLLARSERFLQKGAEDLVSGIAFHGYCGDHFRSVELYKHLHPQHRMIMSEFCMGYQDRFDYAKQLSIYGHEFIGDLVSGADTLFDWNLILDASGGPNHVGNFCMAPVMTDEKYRPIYTMAFSVLSELAKSITPECKVVEHTSFTTDFDSVAVLDKNGTIHLLLSSPDVDQEVNVRIGERIFTVPVHTGTLTVLEVEESEYE
jgi:glucosylceramidase